jgi:hypothetical protein
MNSFNYCGTKIAIFRNSQTTQSYKKSKNAKPYFGGMFAKL